MSPKYTNKLAKCCDENICVMPSIWHKFALASTWLTVRLSKISAKSTVCVSFSLFAFLAHSLPSRSWPFSLTLCFSHPLSAHLAHFLPLPGSLYLLRSVLGSMMSYDLFFKEPIFRDRACRTKC